MGVVFAMVPLPRHDTSNALLTRTGTPMFGNSCDVPNTAHATSRNPSRSLLQLALLSLSAGHGQFARSAERRSSSLGERRGPACREPTMQEHQMESQEMKDFETTHQ